MHPKPPSPNSGNWCFDGFFRVPFRDRKPTSAGFVFAKRVLKQRLAASSAPETDYAQKSETQAFPRIRSQGAGAGAGWAF